jgi:hypothetical protein
MIDNTQEMDKHQMLTNLIPKPVEPENITTPPAPIKGYITIYNPSNNTWKNKRKYDQI